MELLLFREPVNAWTHGLWMLLCVPAVFYLQFRAGRSPLKQIGFAVFGATLILCFAGSALYHAVRLPPEGIELCATLDHIGIYLLIAGTTTPIVLVILRGTWRWSSLALIWFLGSVGITLRVLAVPLPDVVSTGFYILMGWTGLLCYVELARRLSYRALRLLWVGGIVYSVGAVLCELNWPNFYPGVFGAHELFHLFVMAGSLCHYAFMVKVVAAYRTKPATKRVPRVAAGQLTETSSKWEARASRSISRAR